jgi:steroid 5-alpha reductase family enzyme
MTLLLSSSLFRLSVLSGYDIRFRELASSWLTLMIIVIILCFAVSELTRNYSQVDKLWSLMPVAYGWMTVAAFPSARVILMASLITIWGLRLSYNFYRKGGYSIIPWKGEEDYRWKILRAEPVLKGRLRFGLFNLLFISLYQNVLILLFSTPLLLAALNGETGLNATDIVAAVLMLAFIITESIADNQQYRFQQEKKGVHDGDYIYSRSLSLGFLNEGLWKYVRHPNFTSEQAIWICFYFFGVAASGRWINITLAGPVLLVLLFFGSSAMTENISSGKYPGYATYRRNVPRFLPRLFRRQ